MLIRDGKRPREVEVEGNVKELGAFAQQILEQIMWAVENVK